MLQSIAHLKCKVNLTLIDIENLPSRKKKSVREYSSACPICGGQDRFLFWPIEGNYWCRKCEMKGWVGESDKSALTDDQKADLARKIRQDKQAERDKQLSKIQLLQRDRNDLVYSRNLNGNTAYVKRRWGLTDETIDNFNVGYCHACPTSSHTDSITIPYYWHNQLINIRHRLNSPNGSGKYRPEMAGLPTAIYNADVLDEEGWVILVEGEFKAMVLHQYGFIPTIGIPGATNFKKDWLKLFKNISTVFVVLDPGAEQSALKIGTMIAQSGIEARIVLMPTKPDDFFTMYGGSASDFSRYLESSRKVTG